MHLAIKAMKETLGPEDLVTSALVFRDYPQVRTRSEDPFEQPNLSNLAAIAASARADMVKHMNKIRVHRAIRHANPSSADRAFNHSDQVLVWREISSIIASASGLNLIMSTYSSLIAI